MTREDVLAPPGPAIRALVDGPPPAPAEIDAFLEEHVFPLAEGPFVTFVFRGQADQVLLRHWIYGLESAKPFHRLAATDLWYYTVELPYGSRIEYKFEVVEGRRRRLIEDPLNPQRAHDPFGANSVCHATGYEVPEWTFEDPEVRRGSLEMRVVESHALGGPRRMALYTPARFREGRRYPLLVVHDGFDYLRFSGLQAVLDNLMDRHEIAQMVVALIHPEERLEEYVAFDAHARFLTEELVPSLEAELPLLATRSGRGLMGASLGAVASLHAAIQAPDTYGSLLLQSGSFAFSDIGEHRRGPLLDPVAELVNRYRADPVAVAERVFVSCGVYESLIYENRTLVPALERSGMDVRYVEAPDGHNWENWRDRLRSGLSWIFPGDLWLVYE